MLRELLVEPAHSIVGLVLPENIFSRQYDTGLSHFRSFPRGFSHCMLGSCKFGILLVLINRLV